MIYDHERDGAEPRRGRTVADWGGDDLFTSVPRVRPSHAGTRPRRNSGATAAHAAGRGRFERQGAGASTAEHVAAAARGHLAGVVSAHATVEKRRTADLPVAAVAGSSAAVMRRRAADLPLAAAAHPTPALVRPRTVDLPAASVAAAADGSGHGILPAPAAAAATGSGHGIEPIVATGTTTARTADAAAGVAAAGLAEPGRAVPSPLPLEAVAAPARRTVTITGRPDPHRIGVRPARRPSPTIYDWIAMRPDRIAAWAFLLGIILILIAVGTADAAVL